MVKECLGVMQHLRDVGRYVVVDACSKTTMESRGHAERAPLVRVKTNVCLGDPDQQGVGNSDCVRGMNEIPTTCL